MSTIVVKNLPDHLHVQLKERAAQNHRSMNKEVVHLIAVGLASDMADPPSPKIVPRPPKPAAVAAPVPPAVPAETSEEAPETAARAEPATDGRAALRAALIKQADGSFLNVLGIDDEAFFDTLDLIRVDAHSPEMDDGTGADDLASEADTDPGDPP